MSKLHGHVQHKVNIIIRVHLKKRQNKYKKQLRKVGMGCRKAYKLRYSNDGHKGQRLYPTLTPTHLCYFCRCQSSRDCP